MRAARVAAAVARAVAAARDDEARRRVLADDIRRRLAKVSLPIALAAAASVAAVVLVGRTATPGPETFATVVLGRGPATRWIVLDRRPDIPELMAVVGSSP